MPPSSLFENSLLATGITAVSLSAALAMLSPADKALRLLPIGTSAATAASFLSLIAVFMFATDIVFERAGGPPVSHENFAAGARALMVCAVGALLLTALRVLAKGNATASAAPSVSFPIKLRSFSYLTIAISIGAASAAILGYVRLGWFLSVQLLWIATLFCVTSVVWAALNRFRAFYRDAVVHARASENSASFARFQAPAVLFGVSRLLLLVAAFLLALSPFGVRPGETLGEFFQALGGFRVGSIVISLPKILVAILIVAVVMAVGRGVQRWLDEDLFPTTSLDASLRDALQSSVHYFAIVLGLALAFVYLGINVQQRSADRERALHWHRLRSAKHRVEFHLRPDPPQRAKDSAKATGLSSEPKRASCAMSPSAQPKSKLSTTPPSSFQTPISCQAS